MRLPPTEAINIARRKRPSWRGSVTSAEVKRASESREAYHETRVQNGDSGGWCIHRCIDILGGYIADASHSTSVSFKNDTLALAERAKGEDSIAPLATLPHVMFFGGGVVIKLGDEVIGSIGAAGAPGAKLDDGCAHAGIDKIRERLK
jgi:hypothetical protein